MNYIESEEQYQAAMARIEELLPIVKEDTPEDDENYLELVRLSYMVAVSLNIRCKMLLYKEMGTGLWELFQFINRLFQHLALTEHAPEYVIGFS